MPARGVEIIAHRGYSARAPENTLVALRHAIDARADAVEFDLHFTADREPVLFHDFTLERTSGGRGRLDQLTLDALRALDVGDEKAFLVTAAIYPRLFGDLPAIRLFLSRYAAIGREEALARIARWRTGSDPETPGLPPKADSDPAAEVREAG